MVILACGLLLGCGEEETAEEPAVPAAAAQEEGPHYVGDESCATCHGDMYLSFHQTGMGRSLGEFDPESMDIGLPMDEPVYDQQSDYYYEVFVRGDTLFQREYRLDEEGEVSYERVHPAEWVIGSGHATRTFLMNVNGYVTEMPLTWYVGRRVWDMSPGYRLINQRFSRPVSAECMTCHNAYAEHTEFTQAHYTDVPLGITCERCHGPASEHVEARLAGFTPGGEDDTTIVNPADLPRQRQLGVCQQCHLTGITVLKPGESFTSYRPNMPLASHRSVFATEEQLAGSEEFGISSHALRLERSACFRNSDMTCTTCHNPHEPIAELGSNHYNEICMSCHALPDLRAEMPSADLRNAHTSEGNCVSCHMPKSGTSDIPHVVFTDHLIRVVSEEERGAIQEQTENRSLVASQYSTRRDPFELVRVLGDTLAGDGASGRMALEKAVAYFNFYERQHPVPAYLDRVIPLAREGLQSGHNFPEAEIALGRALMEKDSLVAAERVLEAAARRYPENAYAQYWLGQARQRGGHTELAIEALRAAWRLQPALLEAGIALAEGYTAAGNLQEGIRVLSQVLRSDPVHYPRAWNNIGFLYLRQRRLNEAADALREAVQLQPDFAEALVNLGSVYLLRQEWEEAISVLTRATEVKPDYAAAYGNLGVAYARTGRTDRAREALARVLEITPNDQRARTLLRQLNNQ